MKLRIRVETVARVSSKSGNEKGLVKASAGPSDIFTHLRRLCQIPYTTVMGHDSDDTGTLRTQGKGRDPFNLRGSKRRGGMRDVPSPRRYVIASCIRVEA